MQLFGGGQVLVHQHADGDGQRLGADIARHIQHHGLEADDDGQDSHHRLKGTTTEDTSIPRKSRAISQGRRFLTLSKTPSFKSSSLVRPPSFA